MDKMTFLLLCCTSRAGEKLCLSAQGYPSHPWPCCSLNLDAKNSMRNVLDDGFLPPSHAQDSLKTWKMHENG